MSQPVECYEIPAQLRVNQDNTFDLIWDAGDNPSYQEALRQLCVHLDGRAFITITASENDGACTVSGRLVVE